MDSEVTRLLEGAAARVSGVLTINSSSEENNTRIWIEFRPGIDTDQAASDVREAISRIERDLPDALEQLSVYKADERAGEIMRIAVRSSIHTDEELNRFVEQDIVPRIVSLPGVADASLLGSRQRVLRIILDPLRLTSYGLTVADVAAVLQAAPLDVPAGSFRAGDQQLLVRADAAVTSEDDIASLIIRDEIRIGQVAKVAISPEDATSFVRLNGERIVGISVIRQAGSNTVRIADGVRAAVADINTRIEGVDLRISSDDSIFIRGSVREVVTTLLISILVVIGTIRLFTGSMRLTLIPAIAIPISLLGTLAASWAMGFSINILTLLALVLAAGLIVDDAIVVLESVQRQRAKGTGPSAAAVIGTRKVFLQYATTAVLIAVFVPIAFLPGTAEALSRVRSGTRRRRRDLVFCCTKPGARRNGAPTRFCAPAAQGKRLGQSTGAGLPCFAQDGAQPTPAHNDDLCAGRGRAAGLYTLLDQELCRQRTAAPFTCLPKAPTVWALITPSGKQTAWKTCSSHFWNGRNHRPVHRGGRWDPNNVFMLAKLADWRERERSQQEIAADLKPLFADLPGVTTRIFSANSLNLRAHRAAA